MVASVFGQLEVVQYLVRVGAAVQPEERRAQHGPRLRRRPRPLGQRERLQRRPQRRGQPPQRTERTTDWALVRDAADNGDTALAVIDRNGRLVCTNALYDRWFSAMAPTDLSSDGGDLVAAGRAAWRDGRTSLSSRVTARNVTVEVARSGHADDCLVWRFREGAQGNPAIALPALLDQGA
jgi:hypothetical protein